MRTPDDWLQHTPLDDFSSDEALKFIADIQWDARQELEQRIAQLEQRERGLREALLEAKVTCESDPHDQAKHALTMIEQALTPPAKEEK